MPTLTLGDVNNSRIPALCNYCPGSDFTNIVNDATERLLNSGKWWGTCSKLRICATDGCITLPRQVATVETAAICRRPIPVHDFWFEFLQNGIGIRDECSCWPEANMVGQYPMFSDIWGSMSRLLFVCDVAQDVGLGVLVLGYDGYGNWIRTMQNGVWADGEVIPLKQSPGQLSANTFTKVTGIQFPQVMNGQSWLYEYATNNTQRMIGKYANDNIRPQFARYSFPSIRQCGLAKDSSGNPIPVPVDIIGKLAFIPVVNPSDYLMIGCLPALTEMCMGLKKSGDEADGVKSNQIVASALTTAKVFLDDELSHHLGDGRRIGINVQGSMLADAQPVENFI